MEEKYKPICPYIEQGCKGAGNPIVYEQFRDELLKLDDLTLLRGVAV
jgi:hypothetical protein